MPDFSERDGNSTVALNPMTPSTQSLLKDISTALESKDMAEMKMRLCLMESELMGEAMADAPFRIDTDSDFATPHGADKAAIERRTVEMIATTMAVVFHGDATEWLGFMSKAKQFRAIFPLAAPPPEAGVREALINACMRLQGFLDTFGDLGDCVTPVDLNDWMAALRSSPPPTAGREEIAEIIYNAFPYDGAGPPQKPAWLPGGNSLMQDKARATADAILRLTPSPSAEPVAGELAAVSQHLDACYDAAKVPRSASQPLSHFIFHMKRQLEELTSPPVSEASREALEAIANLRKQIKRPNAETIQVAVLLRALDDFEAALAKSFDNAGARGS